MNDCHNGSGVRFTLEEALALLTLVMFSPIAPSKEAETAVMKLAEYCKSTLGVVDEACYMVESAAG
jgi:hypothetical protein